MGEFRNSVLKQELRRELEKGKKLDSLGKAKEASNHYLAAAAIYRRLAYVAPREHSENYFKNADQYENLGKNIQATTPYTRAENPDMVASMLISEKPIVGFEDIGGLEEVKRIIKEAVIIPFIRKKPAFVESPRNILLYGPPGTGKTMLAKAACKMLDATFFEARTSSLLSKYYGESSKIISLLFKKAKEKEPSVIFMDELDSLMISRDSSPQESTRRVIGQLLAEIEGFSSRPGDRIILMAATNKPWDLDDAMVSRFQRRIYVPLPDRPARQEIFELHLAGANIQDVPMPDLLQRSEGYSGRDIANVCREAIMEMIRQENPRMEELTPQQIEKYEMHYRSLYPGDFEHAFKKIKPSSFLPIWKKGLKENTVSLHLWESAAVWRSLPKDSLPSRYPWLPSRPSWSGNAGGRIYS